MKKKITIISIILVSILVIFFLKTVYSKQEPNKILIYTNFDNLEGNNKPDLVLFFSGYTLGSPFLLFPFAAGGVDLSPYSTQSYRKNVVFVSFDTNPVDHWGSPKAVKGILENIRKLISLYNVRKIYIIGGSMGSSLALNIASQAEDDIKSKIEQVIAYLPITDYDYTIKNCNNPQIKEVISNHFLDGNDEKLIQDSSPKNYLSNLPDNSKINLIVATEDKVIPPDQVYEYFNKAKELGKKVFLHKVPGDHTTTSIEMVYKDLVLEMLR